jgi:predicted site-specific integrase-resolvase
MHDRLFLTTAEAANRLGLAPKTLERWRWSGFGPPFVKLGRAARYDVRVLDDWAAKRTQMSTSASSGAQA